MGLGQGARGLCRRPRRPGRRHGGPLWSGVGVATRGTKQAQGRQPSPRAPRLAGLRRPLRRHLPDQPQGLHSTERRRHRLERRAESCPDDHPKLRFRGRRRWCRGYVRRRFGRPTGPENGLGQRPPRVGRLQQLRHPRTLGRRHRGGTPSQLRQDDMRVRPVARRQRPTGPLL